MILLLILMLFIGLRYEEPPPPPQKAIFIELSAGGGGGGGSTQIASSRKNSSSGEQIATQNAVDAPAVATSPNKNQNKVETPKVDERSLYKGGKGGTGTGGGSGSGSGSGIGSGFGPGEGGGSGGSIGYGTAPRGFTYMPNLEIENENGVVYVEIHVSEAGTVIAARIISNKEFPTTITNAKIQADCLARAKTAKFKKGKEEFRIIIFK